MSDRQPAKELKEIEFTVQLVGRKEGKRMGYIKTAEDDWFNVPPGMLSQFNKGEVCKVEYTSKPRDDGGEWRDIVKKISSTPTVPPKETYIAPRQRTDDRDQEQITVRLLMEKLITPDKTWVEIAEIMQQARKVYRMTWQMDKPENKDMGDDEIPY